MSLRYAVETIETIETDTNPVETPSEAPPLDMRCPVCGKKLRIHDPITGEPRPLPPPGKGFSSRAICTGCKTILYHRGDGVWEVLLDGDLTDEDRALDKMSF